MAVNKNFVVKNGLEVNENLIVANATDSFVGVGTSTPNNTLHVFGGIGATDVRVTGFSSFIQSVFVGASGTTFAVIDTPGSNPQVGIGTDIPAYLLDIRSAVSTGQTALYVQGDARITGDLIADDITLDQAEFTNINVTGFTTTGELVVGMGASVTGITTLGHLNRASAGSGGTSVTFNPAAGISTNLQIIGNTYIEGDLKIQSDLEVDADLFIVGIITAGTVHVGSAFSSAGISTFMSDVNIGGKIQTGLEIAGVTTTASSGGITTTGGDLFVGNNLFIKDDITVDTNLNILGVATVGVLSARDAVVSGGSTVNGNVTIGGTTAGIGSIYLPDNSRLSFGTGTGDLLVYHNGSHSFIDDVGTGSLYARSNQIQVTNAGFKVAAIFNPDSNSALYFDGTKRFETTNTGAVVTGILTATGIGSFGSSVNVVGAQFVGGNLTVGGDLDVTGDINLDEIDARNLNVTGIATLGNLGVTSTTTTQDLAVSAGSTFGGLVDINAGGQANTFKVEDLTDNRVVIVGTGGELEDSGNLTFDGSTLGVTGAVTVSSTLGVSAETTLASAIVSDLTDNRVVIAGASGALEDDSNFTFDGANLTLGTGMNVVNVNATGIVTATTFKGVGEVLGIGSEGTPIGSGVSFIDFRSSTGTAFSCLPAVNGIATVTVTPGVSLGLAIALGG